MCVCTDGQAHERHVSSSCLLACLLACDSAYVHKDRLKILRCKNVQRFAYRSYQRFALHKIRDNTSLSDNDIYVDDGTNT